MTLDEVHVNQSAVITKVGGEGVFVVFDVCAFIYAVRRDRRNDAKRVGLRMENRRCRRLSVRACVGLLVHSLSDRGGLLT